MNIGGSFDFSGEYCCVTCGSISASDLGLGDLSFSAGLDLEDLIGSVASCPGADTSPVLATPIFQDGVWDLCVSDQPLF